MLGIVIPVRNEEAGVGPLLAELRRDFPSAVICVVDGHSSDASREVVRAMAAGDPLISLVVQQEPGFARGLRQGLRWALEQGLDPIVQMDADGSHPPQSVAALVAALSRADVAVASRFLPGSRTPGLPWRRRLLSRSAAVLLGPGLGLPLRDPTGGFKAWRASALDVVLRPDPVASGFFVQAELNLWAHWRGLRLAEVPFAFLERRSGRSSMDLQKIVDALGAARAMWRRSPERSGRLWRLGARILDEATEVAAFNLLWVLIGADPLAAGAAGLLAPGAALAVDRLTGSRTWPRPRLAAEALGVLPVAGGLILAAWAGADPVLTNLLRIALMSVSRAAVRRRGVLPAPAHRVRPASSDPAIAGDA